MAVASILPPGKTQFFDANGDPLAAGSVYFYIPTTTTFKNTWKDPTQTTLNTNPVILDSSGEAIIYGSGQYRQQVFDSLGNLIWDQLTADTSYSAGQAGYLLNTNNLSDVSSTSTARTNLGLGTAATQNIGTSGANVPLLNAANTWATTQITNGIIDNTSITSIAMTVSNSSAAYTGIIINNTATGGHNWLIASSPTGGLGQTGDLLFYDGTAPSSNIRGGFDGLGNFTINSTVSPINPGSTTQAGVTLNALNNAGVISSASGFSALTLQRTTSDGQIAAFFRQNTQVGNIGVTATATTYVTSSDARLKHSPEPIESAAIIDALKPYKHHWIVDDSVGYGVYAQEAYEAFPNMVHKGEGEEMWGVDYSKIVPILVAELQSLRKRVAELESNPRS